MRYINPLTDFGFKRLFGSEPHKDLLIAFLNSILQGRKEIMDLEYDMQEHKGDSKEEGVAIFDLVCRGSKGERFIIEVQMGAAPNFIKRSLFYVSRLISGMAPLGNRKSWRYNIAEVYFVALVESAPLKIQGEESEYLHRAGICSEISHQVIYQGLCLVYIELRNFVKQENDLLTDQDRWFYALKHLSTLDRLPIILSKPVFERLFKIAEYSTLTTEDKKMYDISLKRKWDEDWVREGAKEQGRLEGLEQGRIEGHSRGLEEGIKQTAKKMKEAGIALTVIKEATGLSEKEINAL